MSTALRVFCLLLLIIIGLNYKYANGIFQLTNAVCKSNNESLAVVNHCRLRALRRYTSVFNMNVTLKQKMHKIRVNVRTFLKANGYKPFVVNFAIDGCEFMKHPNHPAAKMIYMQFRNYSNINHTCPYEGDQILHNAYPNEDILKLPIPTGDYLIDFLVNCNGIDLISIKIYFSFVEKLKIN